MEQSPISELINRWVPNYDEAAKRLILEGPQWKVKKGKNNICQC